MNNTNTAIEGGGKNIAALIKGTLTALIISFIVFLILAALMLIASIPEWIYATISVVVGLISAFVGGFSSARRAGEKGWLWGGACGLCYYVIIYISALAAFAQFNFSIKTFIMLVSGMLCGALGGLFAMGSRGKKRRR